MTQNVQSAKDQYDEINYKSDLNMSTTDPASTIKTTETQRNGQFKLVIDPSFSIFILRAQIGITATQRTIVAEQTGLPTTT
ncbi:hypothetical protein ACXYUI_27665, partial [Klebsiella pneumoniae]